MAKPYETNPSCFLGCFGFPMKKKSQQKKNTRSLSWPRFRLISYRKSSSKTVPVNNTDKPEVDRSKTKKKPDSTSKHSRQNSKADQRLPTTHVARETRKQTRTLDSEGSLSEPTTKGSSSSLQGSPMIKSKPKKTPTCRLSRAVSLPILEESQRVVNPRIPAPIISKELVEKFEPMIGISVLIVTLIIILLWGRVCAILCTSAWLYICARFRTRSSGNESTGNLNDIYFNSTEYKKKVVLEGLLHRNQPFTL